MMEVSVHRVTNIKMERREYEAFNTVRVTVTDSDKSTAGQHRRIDSSYALTTYQPCRISNGLFSDH